MARAREVPRALRGSFTEQQRDLEFAGLHFQSRIDRMDGLEDGGHVLIDHKSNRFSLPSSGTDQPGRPAAPALAVAAPENLAAVAFARLRPGEMRFMGYSKAERVLPNVQIYHDWPKLLAQWKKDADALGAGFASGDARVDPKDELKTCRNCELQTLCRVYEKFSAFGSEEGSR